MRKSLIYLLIVGILVSAGVFTTTKILTPKDTPMLEICPKNPDRDNWYDCLNAYFLSLSEFGEKPEIAIAELERRMRSNDNSGFKAACHEITHVIGEESYKKIGIEAALAADLYQCIGGYSHGVFWTEAQDKSNPNQWSVEKLQNWCDTNRVIGSLPWEYCIHGSGHSAFIHEYDGVSKGTIEAIKACEIGTKVENGKLDRCLDGVFMTWSVYASLYSKGPVDFKNSIWGGYDFEPGVRVKSQLEFCERVKEYNENYYYLCIEWRSRQVGLEHDIESNGTDLCKFSDNRAQQACYRRMVNYSSYDLDSNCAGAPDKLTYKQCYKNRARLDYERNVSIEAILESCGIKNSKEFCEDVSIALRKDALGVSDMLKRFNERFPELRTKD